MTSNDDTLCALATYIKNEQDGFEFYEFCAQFTTNENGKHMFKSLASDELQHIAKLQGQHDSLLNQGRWLTMQQTGSCTIPNEKAVFPRDRAKITELVNGTATETDALQIAVEIEKESYRTYKSEADKAIDPNAKAVFEELAQEEHEHLETLDNTLSYLLNTGDWYQMKEKPIFEG